MTSRRSAARSSRWRGLGQLRAERQRDRPDHGQRLVLELSIRDADDAVPGRDERGALSPVALEREAIAVELVAVDLDDQPLLRPQAVDLPAVKAGVGHGNGDPGLSTERDHPPLGPRARERRPAVEVEDGLELGGPVVSRTPIEDRAQLSLSRQAVSEGGGDDVLEVAGLERHREVDDRSGGGGDGDAPAPANVAAIEGADAVTADAGTPARLGPDRGHIDRAVLVGQQPPQLSGGPMAQQRTVATG